MTYESLYNNKSDSDGVDIDDKYKVSSRVRRNIRKYKKMLQNLIQLVILNLADTQNPTVIRTILKTLKLQTNRIFIDRDTTLTVLINGAVTVVHPAQ